MLRLVILRGPDGHYAGAEFDGHAGGAQKGKNLACAAVSAQVQTLILGLQKELGLAVMARANKGGGYLAFRLEGPLEASVQEKVDFLFRVFIHGVKWVASQDEAQNSIIIQDAG